MWCDVSSLGQSAVSIPGPYTFKHVINAAPAPPNLRAQLLLLEPEILASRALLGIL